MTRTYQSVTLADAKQMLCAAEEKATALGIAYSVAIVDAGGHLISFFRQDGAPIGTIELAINKAMTARLFDRSSADLASLAQPGMPFFGIQQTHAGKVVVFGGGMPIIDNGAIVGAVGASAGTVEQDVEVAVAALSMLSRLSAP